MSVAALATVTKLCNPPNISFSNFTDIDNEVAACGLLTDDELTNAALSNDESDVEEVPLRPIVTEVSAALSVAGHVCVFEHADHMPHLEHLRKVVVSHISQR